MSAQFRAWISSSANRRVLSGEVVVLGRFVGEVVVLGRFGGGVVIVAEVIVEEVGVEDVEVSKSSTMMNEM